MTVNQALDKILSKYKLSEMDKYPVVQALKINLIEMKINFGGNSELENIEEVEKIITTGKPNKKNF